MAWILASFTAQDATDKKKVERRMLLNSDTIFCYIENPDGTATAMSIAGVQAPMATKFNAIMADMEEFDPDEPDGR